MGVRVRLVPAPVFKTGEGFGNRLLVGSIPMHSRQLRRWLRRRATLVSLAKFFLQDAPTLFGLIELHGQVLNLVVQPHRFLRIGGR